MILLKTKVVIKSFTLKPTSKTKPPFKKRPEKHTSNFIFISLSPLTGMFSSHFRYLSILLYFPLLYLVSVLIGDMVKITILYPMFVSAEKHTLSTEVRYSQLGLHHLTHLTIFLPSSLTVLLATELF